MHRFSACVLLLILGVAGCRSYGGYGSEAATYGQIERILERFDEDLARAHGDLDVLEAAASESPVLAALVAHYARIVEGHETVLEEQRRMTAELSPGSSYRRLHRAYGSMITEQGLVRNRYQALLRYVYEAYASDAPVAVDRDRPYALIPPYYVRAASSGRELTVNEVVARVRSASPRADFSLMMPEMPADEPGSAAGHAASTGGH